MLSEDRFDAAVLHRLDVLRRSGGCRAKALAVSHFTGQSFFNPGQTAREWFDAAQSNMWFGNASIVQAIRHQRGSHGEVAGASAYLEEAEMRVIRQRRDAAFHHQLVGSK